MVHLSILPKWSVIIGYAIDWCQVRLRELVEHRHLRPACRPSPPTPTAPIHPHPTQLLSDNWFLWISIWNPLLILIGILSSTTHPFIMSKNPADIIFCRSLHMPDETCSSSAWEGISYMFAEEFYHLPLHRHPQLVTLNSSTWKGTLTHLLTYFQICGLSVNSLSEGSWILES